MLEYLVGDTVSRILMYLTVFKNAYPREIADTFKISVSAVQKQMGRLEDAGLLVSRLRGNIRLYEWNPRYPFTKGLRAVFKNALAFVPEKDKLMYFTVRTRPRRPGKPV